MHGVLYFKRVKKGEGDGEVMGKVMGKSGRFVLELKAKKDAFSCHAMLGLKVKMNVYIIQPVL